MVSTEPAAGQNALAGVPKGLALGFVPFTTNDGLATVKWIEHYAYVMSLFNSSPIFETRDDATWNAFVGRRTPKNENWIDSFQAALGNIPRLPVSGSDAHRFSGREGDNDKRGYGNFPSGKATWIKADPTWLGLQQAIKEPAMRCYIGETPPKLTKVRDNKTFYIDYVSVNKVGGSALAAKWFDGCKIPLNGDLVAIIGNKGSGKSALADIIALAGNSQDYKHFSFLKKDRFRGKSGEPAKHFVSRIDWVAGDPSECNLADDPSAERVQMVRYIPQGRFEELCNAHVTGKSKEFEAELRAVVFDHLSSDIKLGAHTFEQLVEDQEKAFRAQLDVARQRLGEVNRNIVSLEKELQPEIRAQVEELLQLKKRELEELQSEKPLEVSKPAEQLTVEQEAAAKTIADANVIIGQLVVKSQKTAEQQLANVPLKRAIKSALDQINLFRTQFDEFQRRLSSELEKANIKFEDVVQFSINTAKILTMQSEATELDVKLAKEQEETAALTIDQNAIVLDATAALNGPQQAFQAYQVKLGEWQQKISAAAGTAELPDSKKGLEARLDLFDQIPQRLDAKRIERRSVAIEILDILGAQRDAREQLFEPLQVAITNNELIGKEYDLQFKANLMTFADLVSEPLFSIIKQNVGAIRGEDESHQAVRSRLDKCDMNIREEALSFAESIHDLLHESARQTKEDATDLTPILRKERSAVDAYNFIFGFDYLTPRYTLLFQEMPIEQLSPGQRGALLLIFYLLVDKGRNPIILDQPEENLDNETVISLLVPVLAHAKQSRQILMVTHNPNLAVVCDAEQIIMARFDRKEGTRIHYESGSIEAPNLNSCVVTVLEGTKRAFDNRGGKYHSITKS